MLPDLPAVPLVPRRPQELPLQRWISLDVFRGLAILAVISGGLGFNALPPEWSNPPWPELARQTQQVLWEGCVLWDFLIPAFLFIAGAAVAFSSAARRSRQSYAWMLLRVLWRSAWLMLLGLIVTSLGASRTIFEWTHPLTQLGLGTTLIFLLWRQAAAIQACAALSVLVCYGCFFYFYPVPENFNYAALQTPANYQPLTDLREHWNMHANAAANFDRWFLNLFPRTAPYTHTASGEQTLNCVGAMVVMLFGLMCGEWLMKDHSPQKKLGTLFLGGALGVGIGYALHSSGYCPVVPKLFTPSWVLYSSGWLAIVLGLLFFFFDMAQLGPAAQPLIALGRNSLLVYLGYVGLAGWFVQLVRTHTDRSLWQWLAELGWVPLQFRELWLEHPPANLFALAGDYQPVAEALVPLVCLWALALGMERRVRRHAEWLEV